MALHVESIHFHDFRSYHEVRLSQLGELVVLSGPNAAGKTNLIEGVQLLTALDSFRSAKAEQLIRLGSENAQLSAVFTDEQRHLDMGLIIDAQGRRYRLNGKNRPRRDLRGILPSIVFSPDDLQLVKGSPELRRRALDGLGEQVSRNYLTTKRDYDRLVRQKNHLLKEEVPPSYLESVNEVLVRIGGQLFRYRMHILRLLDEIFPHEHACTTSGRGTASLLYIPSFRDEPLAVDEISRYEKSREEVEELFHEAIRSRQQEELSRRTSLVGPHRDKPAFLLDGRPAADFASQGQQRSLVIAYKLSELKLVEQVTGVKPLLLLDDVMSELDASRRATLVSSLEQVPQTFITTTNLDYFTPELLSWAQVIELPLD